MHISADRTRVAEVLAHADFVTSSRGWADDDARPAARLLDLRVLRAKLTIWQM